MDRWEAASLAKQLMHHHGLAEWRFGFNRQVRGLGICRYDPKRIELSIHYVQGNDRSSVRDTILHEIAHALAGPRAGHGPKWKAKCLQLGCEPRATCRCGEVRMPSGKWRAVCERCGHAYHRHRRPPHGAVYFCGTCGEQGGELAWAQTAPAPRRGRFSGRA